MPQISLSNSKGRDAAVMAESVRIPLKVRWLDDGDRQASSARLLKGSIGRDFDALVRESGSPDKVGEALIAGDPEVDLETSGMMLRDTSRVYVNREGKSVFSVSEMEIVRNPDGSEKLRRPKKAQVPNVNPESPLLWSGKLLPKAEVYRKFVIASKLQLIHVNGLTYDFLFSIAQELEAKKSLLLMGAGPKSNMPLILRRGSVPYRGFLEGRTQGDEYCLLLHLSNMELKAPEEKDATGVVKAE